MSINYRARWATRDRVYALKRAGALRNSIVLDSLKGYILVEPAGSKLGDGKALAPAEADYELSPAWCRDAHSRVDEARRRLGL